MGDPVPRRIDIPQPEYTFTEPNGIWEAIKPAWAPDGKAVVDIALQGIVPVISAPHGVGKTKLLGPSTYQAAQEAGFVTPVPVPRKRVIFPDPTNSYIFEGKGVERVFIEKFGESPIRPFWIIDAAVSWMVAFDEKKPFGRELAEIVREHHGALVLINDKSTKRERDKTHEMIRQIYAEIDMNVREYIPRQQQIPTNAALRTLELIGADAEVVAFFKNPENSAIRNPGLFAVVGYGRAPAIDLSGLNTMAGLRARLQDLNIYRTVVTGVGWSTKPEIEILYRNLGDSEHILEEIKSAPNFD